MTKKPSIPIPSSSSLSHARNGDVKRPKRPRSSTSGSGGRNHNHHHHRRRHIVSAQASDAASSRDNAGTDDSDKGQRKRSQRLFHGVCPDVSNRYRKVGDGRIGQGTYGVVYRARDLWKEEVIGGSSSDDSGVHNGNAPKSRRKEGNNEIVALKKCYAHHEASDGFPITTLREIHALRICSRHPNIVALLEISVSSSSKGSDTLTTDNNENTNEYEDDGGGKNDGKAKAKGSTTTHKSTIKIGKSNVFLVFEHCRYDLAQILDSHNEYHRKNPRQRRASLASSSPFSLSQTKTIVLQLLSALEFCHRHWLIHRDIKPSNLLYDTTTGRLKVCDFGLSRTTSEKDAPMTPNVVSLWYRAPELILCAPSASSMSGCHIRYSFPIDLWATGCVVAELIQGLPFLYGSSEIELLETMEEALGPPPLDFYTLPQEFHRSTRKGRQLAIGLWDRFEYLPPEGLTLLTRLLDYDPNGRWTASTALKADFLAPTSEPPPIKDLGSMPRSFLGC